MKTAAPVSSTSVSAANQQTVQAYFAALENFDPTALPSLLADDVVQTIPFSLSGGPEPEVVLEGKQAVLDFLTNMIGNFSRTVLVDRVFTIDATGQTIFMEATGDLVVKDTGTAYHNQYVFKFQFRDGLITRITEWANPITFAKIVDPQGVAGDASQA